MYHFILMHCLINFFLLTGTWNFPGLGVTRALCPGDLSALLFFIQCNKTIFTPWRTVYWSFSPLPRCVSFRALDQYNTTALANVLYHDKITTLVDSTYVFHFICVHKLNILKWFLPHQFLDLEKKDFWLISVVKSAHVWKSCYVWTL